MRRTLQQTGGAWQREGKTVYLPAWLGARLDTQSVLRWQDSGAAVGDGYSLLQDSDSSNTTVGCLALTADGAWELMSCNQRFPLPVALSDFDSERGDLIVFTPCHSLRANHIFSVFGRVKDSNIPYCPVGRLVVICS